jgi:hypothetical protein
MQNSGRKPRDIVLGGVIEHLHQPCTQVGEPQIGRVSSSKSSRSYHQQRQCAKWITRPCDECKPDTDRQTRGIISSPYPPNPPHEASRAACVRFNSSRAFIETTHLAAHIDIHQTAL